MARRHYTAATVMLICGLWCTAGLSQTADGDDETDGETESDMEEIVVIGEKPGDRERLEVPYEDLMRERLLRELEAQRELEEEFEWRRGPRPMVSTSYHQDAFSFDFPNNCPTPTPTSTSTATPSPTPTPTPCSSAGKSCGASNTMKARCSFQNSKTAGSFTTTSRATGSRS